MDQVNAKARVDSRGAAVSTAGNGNGTMKTVAIDAAGRAAIRRVEKIPGATRIRVVLAEGFPITLAGLDSLFKREPDFDVVACCSDGSAAVRAVIAHRPDILLLDQDLPPMNGLAVFQQVKKAGVPTRVVLLATSRNDDRVPDALRLGVQGVMFRTMSAQELVQTVRDAYLGRRPQNGTASLLDMGFPGAALGPLSPRQVEVARAAASGRSNKELAQQFGVSEGTIKNHLHAIYERLQLDGRLALLLYVRDKMLA
jgi:DNA-binding NarL/FixJ family response regulator